MQNESGAVRLAKAIVGQSLMKRSLNRQLQSRLSEAASSLPSSARVLDVGAKQAPYRSIFSKQRFETVDMRPDSSPDHVGDIQELSNVVPRESYDIVICTEVLEHVRRPWVAVDQIYEVLKPGGLLLATTPFIVPYHPDPTDYWRLTEESWRDILSKWSRVNVAPHGNKLLAIWYLAGMGYGKPLRLLDPLMFALLKGIRPSKVFLGLVAEARK